MTISDIKVTRFIYGNFYVDVCDHGTGFDAWISNLNYGVAMMMFGMSAQQSDGIMTFERFCEIVEANLEEYIGFYEEEYCEEEM